MTDRLRIKRTGPEGAIARVTLARPQVRNAFDATLIAELRAAFAALAREAPAELRAVVLAGDGETFCAGADIGWMRAAMALDVEGNEQDAMAMAEMFGGDRHVPRAGHHPRPGRRAGRRDGPVCGI